MTNYPEMDHTALDEQEKIVQHIESLAALMDSQFKLPGTSINLGLDSIVGLIPGVGDTASLGVSGYIFMQAARLNPPKRKMFRMGFNIFLDWLIGLIPIIGDIFDVGWKANNRNAKMMREFHDKRKRSKPINVSPSDPQNPI
ncbi:DUF4112 domain-containing protein [Litorimonas haliclonae]|uniref:DUF4112 domain-containing protein n=1 Tax=Litorimonas haliclonae TaxID=2081977 RepID=UPI0039F0A012